MATRDGRGLWWFLRTFCPLLLAVVAMGCLPEVRSSGEQLCDWCPAELRNTSEVVLLCQASHGLLKGRCCLSQQQDDDIIVGLDLWNCSLTSLGPVLQNASAAVAIDISGNPLQNLSATLFQGFTNLQYIALPPSFSCPGGNASWDTVQSDTDEIVCRNQRSSCNGTGMFAFLCPENSLCTPDGPGLFTCPCAEDFHGYKCQRAGTFPMFMFYGILGAVTFSCSLMLWCSQRRKVKSS